MPSVEADSAHFEQNVPVVARLRWDERACEHSSAPPAGLVIGCGGVAIERLDGPELCPPGASCYIPLLDLQAAGLSEQAVTAAYVTLRERHLVARGRVSAGRFLAEEVWAPLFGNPPEGPLHRVGSCATAAECASEAVWIADAGGSNRLPLADMDGSMLANAPAEITARVGDAIVEGGILATGVVEIGAIGTCESETSIGACATRRGCTPMITAGVSEDRVECGTTADHCSRQPADACAARPDCSWTVLPDGSPTGLTACVEVGPRVLHATEVYLPYEKKLE
jgi:hypothetical protein